MSIDGRETEDTPALSDMSREELERKYKRLYGELMMAKSVNQQLREDTCTDRLTGILNRQGLERAYAQLATRKHPSKKPREYEQPVCALFVDLDKFKEVNDKHSHSAGDSVLRIAARGMKKALRDTDILGRFGGDEFLAYAQATQESGVILAEKLLTVVRTNTAAIGLPVTASIGVSEILPYEMLEDAAKRADAAMYAAKHNGGNQVIIVNNGH